MKILNIKQTYLKKKNEKKTKTKTKQKTKKQKKNGDMPSFMKLKNTVLVRQKATRR